MPVLSGATPKVMLLDVNVLLALAIHDHLQHSKAMRWFHSKRSEGFSTCSITQSGLVRLFSNPSLYSVRVSRDDALQALQRLTGLPGHAFWPMDVDYETAVTPLRNRITGHKQTTDAYLLGLAIHHGGKLATLDGGIMELARPDFVKSVELIA
jgi:toxin-antitoxin system PIN domain toxin